MARDKADVDYRKEHPYQQIERPFDAMYKSPPDPITADKAIERHPGEQEEDEP